MSELVAAITIVKLIPTVVEGIINIVNFFKGNKEEEEQRKLLEQKYAKEIEEMKNYRKEIEKQNLEWQNKIMEFQKRMIEAEEEYKKREIEKEKEKIEEQRREKEKEIEEIKKKEVMYEQCKKFLSDEFYRNILNIINNFYKEEDKWLNSLFDKRIQEKLDIIKKKIPSLFNELFQNENIIEKINRKIIDVLKKSYDKIELKKMNFMVIGTSGVGKSTLINELLGEQLAKEGSGKRCTIEGRRYQSKNVPFLSLYDTVGTEIGNCHNLKKVKEETLEQITENLNRKDPNQHIHCIMYCTTSNRFYKNELEVILEIRQKYDGKKLPIVIVYTRATKDDDAEAIKKTINEFLNKYNESISDDIFGITYIKVHAKEYLLESNGETFCFPCFGLSDLMNTCYKKGEKSYKIAIKNSLLQIAKNSLVQYIETISYQISNNVNFFIHSEQNFEPNFSNFIAYIFEKLSDIEEQKGFNNYELYSLENIIQNQNYKEKQKSKYNLYKNEKCCIYCHKETLTNPYICENCYSLACETCYLKQFEINETPICKCGGTILNIMKKLEILLI